MQHWSVNDIPPQTGKVAIVTGTGGLGYDTALVLAQSGAEVILAGRNEAKGRTAVNKILTSGKNVKIRFEQLDLASLASVAAFAARLIATDRPIDLLINNAGVMTPPKRQLTSDGFELQLGTNYLGHFALTARLLPLLGRGRNPRVVNLSSLAHRSGGINFDDLQAERRYSPWAAYRQSKLAMLLFAFEMQRRSDAHGWGLMSNAAHPGYARTELIPNGPGTDSFLSRISKFLQPLMSQSSADGALPTLFAATAPEAKDAGYYGPNGFYELKGPPAAAFVARQAKDERVARRLWDVSEQLTGVRWPFAPAQDGVSTPSRSEKYRIPA